jgi:hypothetical protein
MDDDIYFYAFVGLTVFVGLLGLIWPTMILIDRIERRRSALSAEVKHD